MDHPPCRKTPVYLTDDRVVELRARHARGEKLEVLRAEFGISRNAANKLVAGHRRKDAGRRVPAQATGRRRPNYLSPDRRLELTRRARAGERVEGPGGLAVEYGVSIWTVISYKLGRRRRGMT